MFLLDFTTVRGEKKRSAISREQRDAAGSSVGVSRVPRHAGEDVRRARVAAARLLLYRVA